MRGAVRHMLYWGADQIKIENCSPMRSIGRSMDFPAFTDEELTAATDEAHKAGLLVSAHARSAASIYSALKNGVDLITHGTGIDDECIELMIKQGRYLLPTLASPYFEVPQGAEPQNTERFWDLWKAQGRVQWESVKHAYEAGVNIAFATDAGAFGNLNGENVNEFFRMNELGMSKFECLRAATSGAARAMHLDNRTGRVAVGLEADLVVLQDNPLESLETLRNVKMVIKSGKIVKNAVTAQPE
jgi:imidazolonepropionase-like amidohydrolase